MYNNEEHFLQALKNQSSFFTYKKIYICSAIDESQKRYWTINDAGRRQVPYETDEILIIIPYTTEGILVYKIIVINVWNMIKCKKLPYVCGISIGCRLI